MIPQVLECKVAIRVEGVPVFPVTDVILTSDCVLQNKKPQHQTQQSYRVIAFQLSKLFWRVFANGWPKTQADKISALPPVTLETGNAYCENNLKNSGWKFGCSCRTDFFPFFVAQNNNTRVHSKVCVSSYVHSVTSTLRWLMAGNTSWLMLHWN